MLQFNLLPDVKMAYLKTRRIKRVVSVVSLLVTAGSVTLFVLMFLLANIWQKSTIKDLDKDVSASVARIEGTKDLNKILTIQSQIDSLVTLHAGKPVASRLFTHLAAVTPAQVSYTNVTIDFNAHTMNLSGVAKKTPTLNKIQSVNKFVDTLIFATYKTAADAQPVSAFGKVVLSGFSAKAESATFSITLEFDPLIFDSAQKTLVMQVPNKVTTRSELNKPLFSDAKTATETN